MVGCITCFLLVVNFIILCAIDVAYWAVGWQVGLAGIFGIIGFVIGYAISVEMSFAPRDFWWNSEFGVFLKKLGYAWSVAFSVWFVVYFVIALVWGDPIGIGLG